MDKGLPLNRQIAVAREALDSLDTAVLAPVNKLRVRQVSYVLELLVKRVEQPGGQADLDKASDALAQATVAYEKARYTGAKPAR